MEKNYDAEETCKIDKKSAELLKKSGSARFAEVCGNAYWEVECFKRISITRHDSLCFHRAGKKLRKSYQNNVKRFVQFR